MKDQNEREERIREIEAQIADIKRRMPAHSVKPAMIESLEKLEDELEQLISLTAAKSPASHKERGHTC